MDPKISMTVPSLVTAVNWEPISSLKVTFLKSTPRRTMSAKLILICLIAALIAFTTIDAQYAYEAANPAAS
uniref:Secreted protein n=1 Tax=Panagrellus redivivus TaxID=6233 RepID=A0A7E4VI87_PANRE